MAGHRAAGAGRQSQRLQQRHRGRDPVRADHGGRAGDGPVGPDDGSQGGQQLGDVERHLALRGAQLGEAEVHNPGPPRAVGHDVGGPQRAVRDPRPVQPIHLLPQLPQHRVAQALHRDQVQGTAVHAVHHQQRRPIGGLDHLPDGGHRHPGPLRHDRRERLMLDRLDERGGGPGIADLPQPDEPVGAVQQVGVPLIRAEDLDEQRRPVRGGRDERPRALRLDPSRLDTGHRQARRAQRRRDPFGADPPVRHPEQDEHTSPGRYPGGERHNRFHRRGGAGNQPHYGGKPQGDPGSAPPRAAEPRRGGDRDRHGGGQKREAASDAPASHGHWPAPAARSRGRCPPAR